jgi:hypothetical protein
METIIPYFTASENTHNPMLPDYYKVLDVGNDASDMDIKKSYRQKARETHPMVSSSPDAMEKFVLVNEAYEILIHHNTRELYEEDFQSWHNPEEYPIYKYWIDAARSRAREHAKLSWDEFSSTKFYKSTRTVNYVVFLLGIVIGTFLAVSPYLLMVMSEKKYIGVIAIFVALPIGGFMIVQALTGLQAMKKFH